jgi:DNA-binding LacI/PurR family transcriptional regulator
MTRPARDSRESALGTGKAAGIKDVARLAGVSIATVSHATRGTKYVSEELSNKVFAAIQQLNYEVNPVASSLKSKATRVLGVVIPNLNSVFFPQILKGIQDCALSTGYRLTFYNTGFDLEREIEIIRILESSWVDGIILDSLADFDDQGYIDFLTALGRPPKKRIPLVSLERKVEDDRIGSVRIDNYEAARKATRHLLDCGCRRIAHIAGPHYSSVANERRRGYRDELASRGLTYDPGMLVEGDFSPIEGYRVMQKLLQRGFALEGVLAANDQMAIGAMKALKEAGRQIPSEIKVVGFDNVFVTSLVDPALTTIAVPRYQMGYEAARLLVAAIENRPGTSEVLLPTSLIVRGSTCVDGENEWDLLSW